MPTRSNNPDRARGTRQRRNGSFDTRRSDARSGARASARSRVSARSARSGERASAHREAAAARMAEAEIAARHSDRASSRSTNRTSSRPSYIESAGGPLLSRRQLLYGAAGIAAVAAVAGAAVAVSSVPGTTSTASASGLPVLTVPESSVFTTENCDYMENPDAAFRKVSEIKLPFNTLVFADDKDVAAYLTPTNTGKPLSQIGVISLTSGTITPLLDHAMGEAQGYEIYDVRATSNGVVWIEADILEGTWKIYSATLQSGMFIGKPAMLAEGDDYWETPTLAVCGRYAFWQMVPHAEKLTEAINAGKEFPKSYLMRANFGAQKSAAESVYEAPGRMTCAPSSASSGVVIAPRMSEETTNYQLVYIDAQTGMVKDKLTLPAGMRPIDISYGSTGFAFCFNGIYSYGAGIANLGTYTPTSAPSTTYADALRSALSKMSSEKKVSESQLSESDKANAEALAEDAICELYSACDWFRFPRTPFASPAWCGKWFVVKSTKAVVAIDLSSRRYAALKVDDGALDYGDFLAVTGTSERLVTYTNVNYTPINGEQIKECRMKIFRPA